MPLLEVDNLHVAYGELEVVKGVSLAIEAGEIVTVLGSNGAGKTTMLRSLAGLSAASKGRIAFLDRDISRAAAHAVADLGLALVPEDVSSFPSTRCGRIWSSAPIGTCAAAAVASSSQASTRCSSCFPACASASTSRPAC